MSNCEDEDVVCEQPDGACCLNAVNGVQCAEDFTLDHCRVLNGVYLGDDSLCTDDVDCSIYFNNEPVGGCCLPNGDCVDDQTFKDCVTQLEGSWLGENEMCDEEVSCHVPTSACCLPAGDCIETTAENCHALGGNAMGDDITDCQAGLCTEALGSCCTAIGCLNLTETACELRDGTYDPDSDHCLNLDSAFCPSAVGACCSASGCSEITPEDCSAEGGNYYGDGVLCSDAEVDCGNAPGACCVDGDCANIPEESCADLGGQFYGANVLCDSPQVMCEQAPIGACCGAEDMAPCEDIDREKCLDNGGQWYDGVSCDDPSEIFECPVQVGCCLEQGDCIEVEQGRCEALGGTVAGDSCETDEGPVTCPDLTGPRAGVACPTVPALTWAKRPVRTSTASGWARTSLVLKMPVQPVPTAPGTSSQLEMIFTTLVILMSCLPFPYYGLITTVYLPPLLCLNGWLQTNLHPLLENIIFKMIRRLCFRPQIKRPLTGTVRVN